MRRYNGVDFNIIAWSIFIVCVFILVVTFICNFIMNSNEKKKWNDGYCSCGGKWEYEQAVGHYYSTHYIYVCDTCGKRIELYSIK